MRKTLLFIALFLVGCLSQKAGTPTMPHHEQEMSRKAEASIRVDTEKARVRIGKVSVPIPEGWEVAKTYAVQSKRYDEHRRLVDLSYNPTIRLASAKYPGVRLQIRVVVDEWRVNFNEKACRYGGSPSVCVWRGDVRVITYHSPWEERTAVDAWVMRGKTSVTVSIRGAPGLRKDILKTHDEVVQGIRFTD